MYAVRETKSPALSGTKGFPDFSEDTAGEKGEGEAENFVVSGAGGEEWRAVYLAAIVISISPGPLLYKG